MSVPAYRPPFENPSPVSSPSAGPVCGNVTRREADEVVAREAGVAWGDGAARRSKLRAVLVAIDRLSLLVTHFCVALAGTFAALLPPPIEPQGHQRASWNRRLKQRLGQRSGMTPERS